MKYLETIADIFPEKLDNRYKYPLHVPINYNASSPFLKVQKRNKNEPEVSGINYLYVKTFSEKLNFKLHFELVGFMFHDTYKKLENNEINSTLMFSPLSLMRGKMIIAGKVPN